MPAARSLHVPAVLAACLLWGTTGTVAHFAPTGSDATTIGLVTFGAGGLLLLLLDARGVLRLLSSPAAPHRAPPAGWAALGAVGVLLYAALYYLSMSLVGVVVGNAMALGSGPVFAALLELAIDRRRVRPMWVAATAAAVVGIALVAAGASGTSAGTARSRPGLGAVALDPTTLGIGCGLAAGFGYALYSYVGARVIAQGWPSRVAMAAIFALASPVLLTWAVLRGDDPVWAGHGPLVLGYLALLPMACAYLLFGFGLRGLSASTATTLALSEPVAATLLAVAVVGERPSPLAWAGLALIGAGIVTVSLAERRRAS